MNELLLWQTLGRRRNSVVYNYIRELVDSLCRDGADTPIVCVHWKAFLTRERSCSKPFWAPRTPSLHLSFNVIVQETRL